MQTADWTGLRCQNRIQARTSPSSPHSLAFRLTIFFYFQNTLENASLLPVFNLSWQHAVAEDITEADAGLADSQLSGGQHAGHSPGSGRPVLQLSGTSSHCTFFPHVKNPNYNLFPNVKVLDIISHQGCAKLNLQCAVTTRLPTQLKLKTDNTKCWRGWGRLMFQWHGEGKRRTTLESPASSSSTHAYLMTQQFHLQKYPREEK